MSTLVELLVCFYIDLLRRTVDAAIFILPSIIGIGWVLVVVAAVVYYALGPWDTSAIQQQLLESLRAKLEKQAQQATSAEVVKAAHCHRLFKLGLDMESAARLVNLYPAEKLEMLQTYNMALIVTAEMERRDREKVREAFFGAPLPDKVERDFEYTDAFGHKKVGKEWIIST